MAANKERVKLLINALDSGKFDRTTGNLAIKDTEDKFSYCCLGVACEVAKENGLAVNTELIFQQMYYVVSYEGCIGSLPENVKEWYGFSDYDPTIFLDDVLVHATFANDDLEKQFPEIARGFQNKYIDNDS